MAEAVIIRPIISEKSLNQAGLSWYTFAVDLRAGKPAIKKAIKQAFGVKVLAVKTMIVKGKKRRVGRRLKTVSTGSWKKAQVRLPQEQKIDLFTVPTTKEKPPND